MSLATIDTAYTPTRRIAAAPAPAAAPAAPAPQIRAVPNGTEARGFVLYVGIDEAKAAAAGTDLGRIVEALKRLTAEIAPAAQTYAAVALAPEGVGGRDVDVVRLALQDPAAIATAAWVSAAGAIWATSALICATMSPSSVPVWAAVTSSMPT